MLDNPPDPKMTLHVHALGALCIAWATLDRHLIDLMQDLIKCPPEVAFCLAGENIGVRCETIKRLSYAQKYDASWCEVLENVMDAISNDIGAKRNRFVHDYWKLDKDSIQRLDKRARLLKQGAFTSKELVFETWHEHLPDEVNNLSARIGLAIFVVQAARIDVLKNDPRPALGKPLQGPTMLKKIAVLLLPPKPNPPKQTKRRLQQKPLPR